MRAVMVIYTHSDSVRFFPNYKLTVFYKFIMDVTVITRID
ncbi:hypothetical protein R2A130_2014 [Ahrensia sp. R2A130]|nr:hypothetical protein R2A130_2014 [Ahrensia sp. R2A130]